MMILILKCNKELRTVNQHQLHCQQSDVNAKSYQHLIDYYDLSLCCFFTAKAALRTMMTMRAMR